MQTPHGLAPRGIVPPRAEANPSKHLPVEQADPRGVRLTEIDGDLDQLLQEVARVLRHFRGQFTVGTVFLLVIRRPTWTRVKEGADVDLGEGGGRRSGGFDTAGLRRHDFAYRNEKYTIRSASPVLFCTLGGSETVQCIP